MAVSQSVSQSVVVATIKTKTKSKKEIQMEKLKWTLLPLKRINTKTTITNTNIYAY